MLEDDIETPTSLVGRKTTPILQKVDGSHMAESMDIVYYVDSLHGEPTLTPAKTDGPIMTWHEAAWRPILELSIPRLADADLPEFATPDARAAFKTRQTKNFGDFDELIARTPKLVQDIEKQLVELDTLLAGRDQVDTEDFTLYPSLRMLSIVKGIRYPVNVQDYMQRMAHSTGVALHFDQAC